MTAPIKKALDAAVSRKAITAAQEQQILSRLSSTLSQRINQKGLVTPAQGRYAASSAARARTEPAPADPRASRTARRSPRRPATAPTTPKTPAQPGALPQLFQPAPTA